MDSRRRRLGERASRQRIPCRLLSACGTLASYRVAPTSAVGLGLPTAGKRGPPVLALRHAWTAARARLKASGAREGARIAPDPRGYVLESRTVTESNGGPGGHAADRRLWTGCRGYGGISGPRADQPVMCLTGLRLQAGPSLLRAVLAGPSPRSDKPRRRLLPLVSGVAWQLSAAGQPATWPAGLPRG